jgi:Domain of unknown function (DUF4406)
VVITFRPGVFVYLSGPISARDGFTVEENVASAITVYLRCLRDGIACFCPHLSAAGLTCHLPYNAWLAYDFAVIDRCSHVMLLPRWERSPGARLEREYAVAQGKPIVGWEWRG